MRIENDGDLAIYPGHLVLSAFQIDDAASESDENPTRETAIETRRAIFDELVSRNGLLLTTLLGGEGGGRMRRHDSGYAMVPETS